eukprot:7217-Heterococcus_DN1.PRE.1
MVHRVRCWEACTDSSTGPPTAVVTSEAMSYTLIDQGRGGTVEKQQTRWALVTNRACNAVSPRTPATSAVRFETHRNNKLIDLTREGVNKTGAAGRGHVHESERGNVA